LQTCKTKPIFINFSKGLRKATGPLDRAPHSLILRGVSLIGAGKLAAMTSEIDLSGVMEVGRRIVEGGVRGRLVVKIG